MIITLSAETADELVQKFIELGRAFHLDVRTRQMELPLVAGDFPVKHVPADIERSNPATPRTGLSVVPDVEAPAAETKKKAGRPKKSVATEGPEATSVPATSPADVDADFAPVAPEVTEPVTTKEQTLAALNDLNKLRGIGACRGVLEAFGVKRQSELKPEQYGDFVRACIKAGASA